VRIYNSFVYIGQRGYSNYNYSYYNLFDIGRMVAAMRDPFAKPIDQLHIVHRLLCPWGYVSDPAGSGQSNETAAWCQQRSSKVGLQQTRKSNPAWRQLCSAPSTGYNYFVSATYWPKNSDYPDVVGCQTVNVR
jgi:hypothetical protein